MQMRKDKQEISCGSFSEANINLETKMQQQQEHKGKEITIQFHAIHKKRAFQAVLVVKNVPANAGDVRDTGSISGL